MKDLVVVGGGTAGWLSTVSFINCNKIFKTLDKNLNI